MMDTNEIIKIAEECGAALTQHCGCFGSRKPKGEHMQCSYCGNSLKLVGGDVIYPHRIDLYKNKFYLCEPCGAYVGCHPNTTKALGRVANAELRNAKRQAHAAFDPIWKTGKKKRSSAYAWLADKLGITAADCHIGMFDVDMCKRVVEICNGC